MRVRFAPSPTGHLHVGNARTALFNWLLARGPAARSCCASRTPTSSARRASRRPRSSRDLRWLGLDWDEGPDIGGPCGPYRQSERLHLYESYAQELLIARRSVLLLLLRRAARRRASGGARRRPAVASTRARAARSRPSRRRPASAPASVRRSVFAFPTDRDIVFTDVVRGDVRFRERRHRRSGDRPRRRPSRPTTSPSSSTMR